MDYQLELKVTQTLVSLKDLFQHKDTIIYKLNVLILKENLLKHLLQLMFNQKPQLPLLKLFKSQKAHQAHQMLLFQPMIKLKPNK